MSSLAMLLAGRGKSFDPSSLNTWLKNHGGYEGGDELYAPCDLLWCISTVSFGLSRYSRTDEVFHLTQKKI
jgi:hypothetical protein